jgi:hypothetical protein
MTGIKTDSKREGRKERRKEGRRELKKNVGTEIYISTGKKDTENYIKSDKKRMKTREN